MRTCEGREALKCQPPARVPPARSPQLYTTHRTDRPIADPRPMARTPPPHR